MDRRTFLKQTALALTLCAPPAFAGVIEPSQKNPFMTVDSHIKDRLAKSRMFDTVFNEDVFLNFEQVNLLGSSLRRLKKLQATVGYANFSLLDFDQAIRISKSYSRVGPFSKKELDFLESIFYSQVQSYGFLGEKPIKNLTTKINKKDVKKIPYTGNYLYRGKPMEMYDQITQQVGRDVVLTSGVRSVMKQFLLFLNKAKKSRGNLSMASRSLAPPGYSFHGVGDFDVGQKGYGIHNFTERFTQTAVYKKLTDLGYIKFRYERDNDLGVRFEPWHIEVV